MRDFSSLAVLANVNQPSVDRGDCGSPLIGQVGSVHCDVRVVIECPPVIECEDQSLHVVPQDDGECSLIRTCLRGKEGLDSVVG